MGSVMFSDQGILKAFKRAVSKRGWIVTLDKKFSHFKTLNCKSSFSRQKRQTRRKEVRRERGELGLWSKRRILFISIVSGIVEDLVLFCVFECTADTGNPSLDYMPNYLIRYVLRLISAFVLIKSACSKSEPYSSELPVKIKCNNRLDVCRHKYVFVPTQTYFSPSVQRGLKISFEKNKKHIYAQER